MINPNINLDKIRRAFTEAKIAEVPNFLSQTYADSLFNFFNSEKLESSWIASFYPSPIGKLEFLRNTKPNQPRINKNIMHVSRAFVAGKFSYCFYGFLEKHDDSCKCTACVVRGFFHRSETIMKFSTMTGMHLVQCNEVICSCYKGGNFLSPHEDKAKGKLGFVLNLSRDWLPQFGGNLNFLDDDWIHIRKVVVPKFNNLVLFDLPKGKGVPHFVSHIFPGVSLKRLGIAGWFS